MLLDEINSPADLKKLGVDELQSLCEELREFIVNIVSKEGGHLSASLGVVELTVALHHALNTPDDKLVWDVGHQAYGHKILTGRKDVFQSNRKYKGISGFPKISESAYDSFGTGHSSTAISAVLGMAVASQLENKTRRMHVAVVGDGALTGGISFEGLNHAGATSANILIVINDNSISIDENGGALKEHLAALKLKKADGCNLFKDLGFDYSGPVDGHNLELLLEEFKRQKELKGPRILHLVTKKGKGYAPAEEGNAVQWHAPGVFDVQSGKVLKASYSSEVPLKYQEIFGKVLLQLAEKNEKIIGVTPAMPSGSSMNLMMKAFPDRTFDVDIAEQHAVTFSAGVSTMGFTPFCNIYSTFLQRGYDQLIHDVALQNLKVVFCIDRAGLVGEDGATHHGAFDLAYLRCIPNLIVAAPMDGIELANMLYSASLVDIKSPISIRYPRGYSDVKSIPEKFEKIKVGAARLLNSGSELLIISIGTTGLTVQDALGGLEAENRAKVSHLDLRFLKPLDEKSLKNALDNCSKVITIEDGVLKGGMSSAILEFMNSHGFKQELHSLGIADSFISQGSIDELKAECGFDLASLEVKIRALI